MRFVYARLKGYIGIYNGLGLHEIQIDFSKCKNRVVIISGKNGSGKSTILKALTPLPDSADNFTPNVEAEKELHIVDDENNLYVIRITSPVSNSGRGQTKAYISKNGFELNTNGNIGTYKDTLFSEFELDPNYITLSRLSSNDRGLADKTPSERKKFIASIIESIEVYNNMNKVLSKKSNIFKSYVNNLGIKIKNIGDEEALRSSIFDLDNRYNHISSKRIELEKAIADAEAFIKVVDPDNSIQDLYSNLYTSIKNINSDLDVISSNISKGLSSLSLDSEDVVMKEYVRLSDHSVELEYMIKSDKDKLTEIISQREEDLHILDIKNQKINSIKSEYDVDKLKTSVRTLRKVIETQEKIFRDSGITNFDVSRDEYLHIYNTLKKIKHLVNVFKTDKDVFIVEASCKAIIESAIDKHIDFRIEQDTIMRQSKYQISDITSQIKDLNKDISTMDILSSRPKNCKIDTCPLISNAVNIQKTNPNKRVNSLHKELKHLEEVYNEASKQFDLVSAILSAINELSSIIEIIDSNDLLDKVPVSYVFRNREEFIKRIINFNSFNEIEDSDVYIENAEEIESYRDNKELLVKLESELNIINNKNSMIDDLVKEVLAVEEKLKGAEVVVERLNTSIKFNTELLNKEKSTVIKLSELNDIIILRNNLLKSKEEFMIQYNNIKDNLSKIRVQIDTINYSNSELEKIYPDINSIDENRKRIEHSLITLEEYKQELDTYREKFNVCDKLKKYSSPTSEGIQTLFMDIYMSKTLNTCNELLSMMFENQYRLLQYVINADEFRIPFIGEGMEVDDISSGSTSQVCMMGMIVNLVLLFQASTVYNIVGLDEISSGLDTYNRFEFINTLYKLIDIMGLGQVMLISHGLDINMANTDVILLKGYDNMDDPAKEGNVIFNYYNYI